MMNTRRETSIQVQTVLFCNDTYSLLRSLKHMANAVRVARQNGVEVHVRVAWGILFSIAIQAHPLAIIHWQKTVRMSICWS